MLATELPVLLFPYIATVFAVPLHSSDKAVLCLTIYNHRLGLSWTFHRFTRLNFRVLANFLRPHIDCDTLLDLDLPRPPPCGWSNAFMATPLTCGRKPLCRLLPALPQEVA